MTGKISYKRDGTCDYSLDGRDCTKEEFDAAFPARELGPTAPGGLVGWPMYSEAMAVHPAEIEKAMEKDRRIGAPVTEYDSNGCPKLENPGHHRQYRRAHGFRHNSSFTE